METSRVRLDLKGGGRVSITKSAIVAAVRILEQDSTVGIKTSSQELANWVVSHIKATHSTNDEGYSHVVGKISWAPEVKTTIYGLPEPIRNSRFAIILDAGKVINATEVTSRGLHISEALPRILAKAIRETPNVKVLETNIDEFI